MRKYEKTKDSGIDWVGPIPEHWAVKPLFALFRERQALNYSNKETNVLSLSHGKIIRRDVDSNFGLLPESFETYNIIEPGNIVLRLTDLQNDKRSLRCGFVGERGIITSAYLTLEKLGNVEILPAYVYYLLHSYDIRKVFYGMGGGVRQSIKFEDLKRLPIFVPPLKEQVSIVEYLNLKVSLVDLLISEKKKNIKLLNEDRAAVVNHAVTGGINASVAMKDSGISWLGRIPKQWDLKRLKYLATVNQDSLSESTSDDYEFDYIDIGNVDLEGGITSEERIAFNKAPSRARRMPKKGDTIISTVRTYLKAVAHIDFDPKDKICSTGFAVIHPKDVLLPKFLYYILRSERFVNRVEALSVGVSYPAINASKLMDIVAWYPSINEQKEIVSYLDAFLAKANLRTANLNKEIGYLSEYRNALVSEAVDGKISVIR